MPWKNAKGIRDILSHHYFDLDAEVIFNIYKKDANELLETTIKIIEELN
ncbi:HepT-like ribonuclease domain-containing protein [Aliarcobacter cryaerophilus]